MCTIKIRKIDGASWQLGLSAGHGSAHLPAGGPCEFLGEMSRKLIIQSKTEILGEGKWREI